MVRQAHHERPKAFLYLLFLLALFAGACSQKAPQTLEITGVLVDVQAREIVHADSVRVRDAAGREWDFQVSPGVASDPTHPNTASHLRQHLVFGDPVIVHYRETPQGLLAMQILDVTPPTAQ